MAITPGDYGRRVELTGLTPGSSLSGYTAVITEANLPSEIWSLAENGGGDLRVCENSDGTGQLPLEVVLFDTVSEVAVLWVRFPTYSMSNRTCWIFYDNNGDTQPPVTDTFGRNAVYLDAKFAHHLSSTSNIENSSGNSNWDISSFVGGVSDSSESPFGGSSVEFDGSTGYGLIDNNSSIVSSSSDPITLQVWVRPKNIPNDEMGIFGVNTDSNSGFRLFFDNSDSASGSSDTYLLQTNQTTTRVTSSGSNSVTLNGWQMLHITNENGVDQSVYLQGSLVDSATGQAIDTQFGDWLIGSEIGTSYVSSFWEGQQAELRLINRRLTHDHVSLEYDNQSSPGTFWTTGTPEDTGGGGGATYTLSINAASYTFNPASVALGYNRALTIQSASYSFTASEVTLAVRRILPINSQSYSFSPSQVELAYNRAIDITPAAYSYSPGTATLIASRILSISPASYTYTPGSVALNKRVQQEFLGKGGAISVRGRDRRVSISSRDRKLTARRSIRKINILR